MVLVEKKAQGAAQLAWHQQHTAVAVAVNPTCADHPLAQCTKPHALCRSPRHSAQHVAMHMQGLSCGALPRNCPGSQTVGELCTLGACGGIRARGCTALHALQANLVALPPPLLTHLSKAASCLVVR
jgi:hypothetical protein